MTSKSKPITKEAKAHLDEIKLYLSIFFKKPNSPILEIIFKYIDTFSDETLQEIQIPTLFPFIVILEKSKKNECFNEQILSGVLHLIKTIFLRTKIDNSDLFLETMSVVSTQIFDREAQALVPNTDENVISHILEIIKVLCLRVNNDLRVKIYSRSHAPQIAQCVYICNQVAIYEKRTSLRLGALNAIMALCTVNDELMKTLHTPAFDKVLLLTVGDLLMFILPGILLGLKTIALGDVTQSHIVTYTSIKASSRIISLCLHDTEDTLTSLTATDFANLIHNMPKHGTHVVYKQRLRKKNLKEMKEHLVSAKKDEAWYKTAGEKLANMMTAILPLHSHSHEKVRYEIAQLCVDMFTYCPRHMEPSLKYLIEVSIALSEDSDPKVAKTAKAALNCYLTDHSEFIIENLNMLIGRFPRLLNTLDIDNQLSSGLNLLKGYIRMLTSGESGDQDIMQYVTCPTIMNRLGICLLEIFKMENHYVKLLDDCAIRDIEANVFSTAPWKTFTYLDSEKNITNALEVCQIIGESDAAEIVILYFMDFLNSGNEYLKEAILILNEITIVSKTHLIENLMAAYFEPKNWYLPIKVARNEKPPTKDETLDVSVYNPRSWSKDSTPGLFEGAVETRYTDISYSSIIENNCIIEECDEDSCMTIGEAKNNVICICLMTEGIGRIAKVFEKDFEMHLLKSLYLILERAGNNNEMIHLAGLQTLKDIAEACGLENITQLIKENSDYFSHHVNINLKNIAENPGVLDVLFMVMKYSEASVLPCLYEILENIMKQCFNPLEKNNYESFLKLFLTFIKYVKSNFSQETPEETQKEKNISNFSEFKSQLAKFTEQKNILRDAIHDTEDEIGKSAEEMWKEDQDKRKLAEENGEIEDFKEEPTKPEKKNPLHIQMLTFILKKTLNFIPAVERSLSLLALDIMREGFLVIRYYENELLPLVHQVWRPLVSRFKSSNHPVIINRSFKLLAVLADVSKDFIKPRTIKDVMPTMCMFLKNSAKESKSKKISTSYQFGQTYKLQLSFLEELGDLVISLNLPEKQTNCVMNAADAYLSKKQLKPLQEASIKFFKKLLSYDSANCWLHLNGLSSQVPLLSNPENTNMYKSIDLSNKPANVQTEYDENVKMIFV